MKLSTIIINYNTPNTTKKAVKLLKKATLNIESEIILIDNNSEKKIEKNFFDNNVKIIFNKENYGFSKAVNQGIKISNGDFILLLNSDAFIEKNTVTEMINFLEKNKQAGIIGPKIILKNGNTQPSFGKFSTLWRELMRFFLLHRYLPGGIMEYENLFNKNKFNHPHKTDWISGGCMMIRKEVFKNNNFDENYFFGVEDHDFCFQAKKNGWEIIFFPLVKIVHYHGFSSGGSRSIFSMSEEIKGINYFWKKNYPKKVLQRKIVIILRKIKYWVITELINKK